ncbi:hypothetical protein [Microbispora triticiradicis]|uniref:hypothetical protein n=1 Tax=Microbispora triticiradicis TaxID=2200763 RepID=UPI001AD74195|nr:hypothetical protein [Microbispora triticiradicis]
MSASSAGRGPPVPAWHSPVQDLVAYVVSWAARGNEAFDRCPGRLGDGPVACGRHPAGDDDFDGGGVAAAAAVMKDKVTEWLAKIP